jgi:hypothetical protein
MEGLMANEEMYHRERFEKLEKEVDNANWAASMSYCLVQDLFVKLLAWHGIRFLKSGGILVSQDTDLGVRDLKNDWVERMEAWLADNKESEDGGS